MSRRRPARTNNDASRGQGDLLFGLQTVRSALQSSDVVEALWIQSGRRDRRVNEILRLADDKGVAVQFVPRHELDRRAGDEPHQGVVARARASVPLDEAALLALVDRLTGPALLLVLDGVQDPHNLGACLRTADAAGAHAVVAPRDRAAGLTPTVRKVACGAAEQLPFAVVTNLARTLRALADRELRIVGAAGEGGQRLYDVGLSGPVALVLGGEARGLRRLTRESCHVLVHLPMLGHVESLNVSVAAGVCLYEAVRQRAG